MSRRVDPSVLVGVAFADEVVAEPATIVYCERLAGLPRDREGSLRFLAHHYTRYLGDLSGGQLIGRAVRDSLDIDARSGAASA